MQETQIWSLGQEDPLEEEMASHSNILAWKILWTEEPGGLQSMGSQKSQTQLTCLHTIETSVQLLFNRESTCNALCKYCTIITTNRRCSFASEIFIYFRSTSESNISDVFLFTHLEKFKLASVPHRPPPPGGTFSV